MDDRCCCQWDYTGFPSNVLPVFVTLRRLLTFITMTMLKCGEHIGKLNLLLPGLFYIVHVWTCTQLKDMYVSHSFTMLKKQNKKPPVFRYWPYGSSGCQTHGFQGFVTALASIHFVAAIAWDRYHQYCTSKLTTPPPSCPFQAHTKTQHTHTHPLFLWKKKPPKTSLCSNQTGCSDLW